MKIGKTMIQTDGRITVSEACTYLRYRIFSIKRPRRLFQTWLRGPGVYLNSAVYSQLISLNKGFKSLFVS